MDEIIIEKIEWSTLEHEHKDHSVDWFWTIGLITLISCGASLWFGNYIFSIFIFISGISLILVSIRHPQEMNFVIKTKGLIMALSCCNLCTSLPRSIGVTKRSVKLCKLPNKPGFINAN